MAIEVAPLDVPRLELRHGPKADGPAHVLVEGAEGVGGAVGIQRLAFADGGAPGHQARDLVSPQGVAVLIPIEDPGANDGDTQGPAKGGRQAGDGALGALPAVHLADPGHARGEKFFRSFGAALLGQHLACHLHPQDFAGHFRLLGRQPLDVGTLFGRCRAVGVGTNQVSDVTHRSNSS